MMTIRVTSITIAGFSWEFVWWSTDVSVNTQFIVETIFAKYQFCCMHMCLLWLHFWHWKYKVDRRCTLYRRWNYLETSITITKMPGYIAQNLSQLYQSSTNVRLHSFSFIIQFLSLQSGWLSWSRSVSLLSKTFYGLNLARVLPIFFIQDHVCLICSICINYIICIPIIFVLNHHIHTFSIHYTRSFSIIKIFIIGQVLSYTNNCKKTKQSS